MNESDFRDRVIDRLARIETWLTVEHSERTREAHRLEQRIATLERRRHEPIDSAGLIKLTLAVAIPLAVLAWTGNLDLALKAARGLGP